MIKAAKSFKKVAKLIGNNDHNHYYKEVALKILRTKLSEIRAWIVKNGLVQRRNQADYDQVYGGSYVENMAMMLTTVS